MKLKIEIDKVFASGKLGLSTVRLFDGEGVILYEVTESNPLISDQARGVLDFALKILGLESER